MNKIHDDVITLIQRAEADAYARGKADAKRELLAFLGERDQEIAAMPAPLAQPVTSNSDQPIHERQRAPKGIVPKFINKILVTYPGLTPNEIKGHAGTAFEQMIKTASIRGELRNGREDGRFREEDGRWFLVASGEEKEEAEAATNDTPASLYQTADGR